MVISNSNIVIENKIAATTTGNCGNINLKETAIAPISAPILFIFAK